MVHSHQPLQVERLPKGKAWSKYYTYLQYRGMYFALLTQTNIKVLNQIRLRVAATVPTWATVYFFFFPLVWGLPPMMLTGTTEEPDVGTVLNGFGGREAPGKCEWEGGGDLMLRGLWERVGDFLDWLKSDACWIRGGDLLPLGFELLACARAFQAARILDECLLNSVASTPSRMLWRILNTTSR